MPLNSRLVSNEEEANLLLGAGLAFSSQRRLRYKLMQRLGLVAAFCFFGIWQRKSPHNSVLLVTSNIKRTCFSVLAVAFSSSALREVRVGRRLGDSGETAGRRLGDGWETVGKRRGDRTVPASRCWPRLSAARPSVSRCLRAPHLLEAPHHL